MSMNHGSFKVEFIEYTSVGVVIHYSYRLDQDDAFVYGKEAINVLPHPEAQLVDTVVGSDLSPVSRSTFAPEL